MSGNGTVVGSQIMDQAGWDIADLLRPGKNTLSIKVRTTLRNAVSTYNKKSTPSQPYGLRGPVTLSPVGTELVYKSGH